MSKKNLNYQVHEIDLKELIIFLKQSKKFIISFTTLLTVMAVLYTLSLPQITPTYKSTIYFFKPNQVSILELNKMLFFKETDQSVFYKFLTKALSREFQKKILFENIYIDNTDNGLIDAYVNSIKTLDEDNHEKSKLAPYQKPWAISVSGGDPKITSSFLNDLIFQTNKELLKELIDASKIEISSRLKAIEIERSVILRTQQNNLIFDNELLQLNIEEEKLKLFKFNKNELILIKIDNPAIIPKAPLKEASRKRSIILTFQIFASFMLSIFLVLIRNILRNSEDINV
jgi:LPS O-antigen subunit length determinant protein (WzzB/FepE family)